MEISEIGWFCLLSIVMFICLTFYSVKELDLTPDLYDMCVCKTVKGHVFQHLNPYNFTETEIETICDILNNKESEKK